MLGCVVSISASSSLTFFSPLHSRLTIFSRMGVGAASEQLGSDVEDLVLGDGRGLFSGLGGHAERFLSRPQCTSAPGPVRNARPPRR